MFFHSKKQHHVWSRGFTFCSASNMTAQVTYHLDSFQVWMTGKMQQRMAIGWQNQRPLYFMNYM